MYPKPGLDSEQPGPRRECWEGNRRHRAWRVQPGWRGCIRAQIWRFTRAGTPCARVRLYEPRVGCEPESIPASSTRSALCQEPRRHHPRPCSHGDPDHPVLSRRSEGERQKIPARYTKLEAERPAREAGRRPHEETLNRDSPPLPRLPCPWSCAGFGNGFGGCKRHSARCGQEWCLLRNECQRLPPQRERSRNPYVSSACRRILAVDTEHEDPHSRGSVFHGIEAGLSEIAKARADDPFNNYLATDRSGARYSNCQRRCWCGC